MTHRSPPSPPSPGHRGPGLRVLVVDDEGPALDEVAYLLGLDERVGEVLVAASAAGALRLLRDHPVDAVFLDIHMPGRTGLELAQGLRRTAGPPAVVFVTAHEGHAVEAFDLHAVDYVLKPVRAERLGEAVRRVLDGAPRSLDRVPPVAPPIAVELGGVTRFVDRGDVTHVEASGDYARLHTATGSHLIRTPLSALETEWAGAGFLRVHRSLLVALAHVREVRMDSGRCSVVVGDGPGHELQVSRRHTRELRERLLPRTGS